MHVDARMCVRAGPVTGFAFVYVSPSPILVIATYP